MKILVTGGAGYIGSHTLVELLEQDFEVVVIDNLVNSSAESIKRVEKITHKKVPFFQFDLRDNKQLEKAFNEHTIDAVIHFAGLKAVGESTAQPIDYYDNNIGSTTSLLKSMRKHDVKNMVFSSSATVYGNPESLPISEDTPMSATNPYGHTKLMIEQILTDVVASNENWSVTSLRYFNPVGAHSSGIIGEDPNDTPNNLLPYISQVAAGKREKVTVFGDDYPTKDGTGVRDYVHVVDLAQAHIAALKHIDHPNTYKAYNIGTGEGTSVLEMIHMFGQASGKQIPYEITSRRPGDIATCYADASLAQKELSWSAQYTLQDACQSAWKWQSQNPDGFSTTNLSD